MRLESLRTDSAVDWQGVSVTDKPAEMTGCSKGTCHAEQASSFESYRAIELFWCFSVLDAIPGEMSVGVDHAIGAVFFVDFGGGHRAPQATAGASELTASGAMGAVGCGCPHHRGAPRRAERGGARGSSPRTPHCNTKRFA